MSFLSRVFTQRRRPRVVNHPNSVSVIDFGRTEDGILYLAMEFLKGRDLYRLQQEEGLLPVPRACTIVSAVLDALAEAHALNVVHRDLKLENIIIERPRSGGDLVKVVDFGLAKLMGHTNAAGTGTTTPGLVCGTPDYMAPEQGRGYEVDGRGDIYTVGVVLFELLTGHLPYSADTPTGVVLRHIQDPIPDPRKLAPQRNIPDNVANIVMRAMAKSPGDRYQSAEEMAQALRAAVSGIIPKTEQRTCTGCGHSNSSADRFCSSCGAPLRQSMPSASTSRRQSSSVKGMGDVPPLVARDRELADLKKWHLDPPSGRPRVIMLTGEAGVGRTRLLCEFAEFARQQGHVVATEGPHESGALVPYHSIMRVVLRLLDLDALGMERLGHSLADAAPLVAAGLLELGNPVGLRGSDSQSRASAVASAFLYAVEQSLETRGAARVLVALDDLDLCDGLTQQVVRIVAEEPKTLPFTLLVVDEAERDRTLGTSAQILALRRLSMLEARAMLEGREFRSLGEPDPEDALVLPLFVEQLHQVGLSLDQGMSGEHARLADLVSQRLDRLSAETRHVMQAVAVLGQRADASRLARLLGRNSKEQLAILVDQGLVTVVGASVFVQHPYVRDLVEASIPAEARRDLHARALSLANEDEEPLEVRAHHAFGSGEALGALVLLERMGRLALSRGDVNAAVLGYQRALSLARRELLEKGDTFLEGVIESVSHSLGHALLRRGDPTGAEGVLREAYEYSAPASVHRAEVQLGLAEVLAAKDRIREAYRMLGQALEFGVFNDASSIQIAVQVAVAALRRSDGDLQGALSALRSAEELLAENSSELLQRAEVAMEIGRCLADLGDSESAINVLKEADELAVAADSPYLQARVAEVVARVMQAIGDAHGAQQKYAQAASYAERAGAGRLTIHYRSLSLQNTASKRLVSQSDA